MFFDNKFNLIISIGEDCACTSYLRRFNLQNYSYPFDWLTKATFQTRINLLVNNFDKFLEKENIHFLQKPVGVNVDNEHDYYQDKLLDFYFYHDFKVNVDFEEEFVNVKNKYSRRIERLYRDIESSKNILFVWWSRDKHQDESVIIESYEKLKKKFGNKNIYFLLIEPNESQIEKYFCNNHILLIKYDNISYKHNSRWNETMGNETNNIKIFSQIKKKRSLKWYMYMAIYKFVKIFINLIPNCKVRKLLSDHWSYRFFRNKL